ncbi:hypothetical protein PUMCH_001004 [Australozyma saopauloensis]|uniref:N-glycosylation protein EOS1 n=1 Tax=Australozyma saopauloensis TaxID=291208 RepID=A0AAX4H5I9_9ASCO|nr:hypothetical protein PUMCH_001004 [[Candida] saopauloensis]
MASLPVLRSSSGLSQLNRQPLYNSINELHDLEGESDNDPVPPLRSRMNVQHGFYDPGERIPSYESSQEQHSRRLGSSAGNRQIDQALPRSGQSIATPPILTTTNARGRAPDTPSRIRDRGGSPVRSSSRLVKTVGLKFLSARQHFLLATCRDLSLIPCVVGLCRSWWVFVKSDGAEAVSSGITTARVSEHFLTGLWCIVAGYLLFSVLDGLMVRWIVGYSITGAIVRMAAMSAILVAIEEYLVAAFSAEGFNYALHTWILISCALTVMFIAQNFITSNIDLKGKYRPRFFDFYKIAVFAVVPVGMASFITMIGLLRSLLILRLDIDLQRAANNAF